jgi:hypothetical protein
MSLCRGLVALVIWRLAKGDGATLVALIVALHLFGWIIASTQISIAEDALVIRRHGWIAPKLRVEWPDIASIHSARTPWGGVLRVATHAGGVVELGPWRLRPNLVRDVVDAARCMQQRR